MQDASSPDLLQDKVAVEERPVLGVQTPGKRDHRIQPVCQLGGPTPFGQQIPVRQSPTGSAGERQALQQLSDTPRPTCTRRCRSGCTGRSRAPRGKPANPPERSSAIPAGPGWRGSRRSGRVAARTAGRWCGGPAGSTARTGCRRGSVPSGRSGFGSGDDARRRPRRSRKQPGSRPRRPMTRREKKARNMSRHRRVSQAAS